MQFRGTNGFKQADGAGQFWGPGSCSLITRRSCYSAWSVAVLHRRPETADLLDPFAKACPLQFTSPNAPEVRDVLGTLLLSIVTGGRRYAHVNALRHDGINPPLLGMSKVCSDDSVRRALKSIDEEKAKVWLKQHLTVPLHPVMQDGWILDVDTTVKPIYGKQEGAEVGYNPPKPGRPSHCYHSYLIANMRLVLGVDVTAGNESNSLYSLPRLLEVLDDLPAAMRPFLVRGDCRYGNEAVMSALEERGQDYLLKLRMTKRAKELVAKLSTERGWYDMGKGWYEKSSQLQLMGWSRKRRAVVMRRRRMPPKRCGVVSTDRRRRPIASGSFRSD